MRVFMNCQWLLVWAEWGQSAAWHCGPTGSPERDSCPSTRCSELHWPALPAQADFPPKTAFQLACFYWFFLFSFPVAVSFLTVSFQSASSAEAACGPGIRQGTAQTSLRLGINRRSGLVLPEPGAFF